MLARNTAVPAWLLEVLADPETGEQLDYDGAGTLRSPAGATYSIESGLVDLAPKDTNFDEYDGLFGNHRPGDLEVLTPGQIRFRKNIRSFLRSLPAGATVLDAGSSEAEFHDIRPDLRFIPLDLARTRLRYALSTGRSDFVLLADLRKPPLRQRSIDIVICTHVLQHLDDDAEIVAAATSLLQRLAPGGRAFCTIPIGPAEELLRQNADWIEVESSWPSVGKRSRRYRDRIVVQQRRLAAFVPNGVLSAAVTHVSNGANSVFEAVDRRRPNPLRPDTYVLRVKRA